ncbi:hypothetical protein DPEC_G00102980 [Dallia pectoralis]|uniref:Uncharacterized protein n=1 Tax=Dallia pectoralis TaxID=75939 RepID=A0ACC2GWV8_DALPE|nr:hypothetical protein DPEC_G00102980 [Dallia pectoralis]
MNRMPDQSQVSITRACIGVQRPPSDIKVNRPLSIKRDALNLCGALYRTCPPHPTPHPRCQYVILSINEALCVIKQVRGHWRLSPSKVRTALLRKMACWGRVSQKHESSRSAMCPDRGLIIRSNDMKWVYFYSFHTLPKSGTYTAGAAGKDKKGGRKKQSGYNGGQDSSRFPFSPRLPTVTVGTKPKTRLNNIHAINNANLNPRDCLCLATLTSSPSPPRADITLLTRISGSENGARDNRRERFVVSLAVTPVDCCRICVGDEDDRPSGEVLGRAVGAASLVPRRGEAFVGAG